jgi:hypothetical protein
MDIVETAAVKLLDDAERVDAEGRRSISREVARMIEGTELNSPEHPVRQRWIALLGTEVRA